MSETSVHFKIFAVETQKEGGRGRERETERERERDRGSCSPFSSSVSSPSICDGGERARRRRRIPPASQAATDRRGGRRRGAGGRGGGGLRRRGGCGERRNREQVAEERREGGGGLRQSCLCFYMLLNWLVSTVRCGNRMLLGKQLHELLRCTQSGSRGSERRFFFGFEGFPSWFLCHD